VSLEEELHPTYFALNWLHLDDRTWTDGHTERYLAGGHDGVDMWFGRDLAKSVSFSFLRSLPKVRGVSIVGPVRDDLAAFDVTGLECLILVTKCVKPMRLESLTSLRDLRIDDRPGIDCVRDLSKLEYLAISKYRGADLGFMGRHPDLRGFRLEGRGQRTSLSGVEQCTSMTFLDLWEINPDSLAPVQPLRNLTHVQIRGKDPSPDWSAIDLEAFRGMNRLEWLYLIGVGSIRSLAPIREIPNLKGVTLAGCVIEDGDLSPLVDLPPGVSIVPPDDRPHYRPSVEQLMALRSHIEGVGRGK